MNVNIQILLNIDTNFWIKTKNKIEKNEMKHTTVYRSIKEICQANSKHNIIQKSPNYSVNDHLQQRKTNKRQQQKPPMDDHNENRPYFYKKVYEKDNTDSRVNKQLDKENYLNVPHKHNENSTENRNGNNNNSPINYNNILHVEKEYNDQFERNQCLKSLVKNPENQPAYTCLNGSEQNQKIFSTYNNHGSSSSHINNISYTSDNIDREEVQNIVADYDGEVKGEEDDNDGKERSTTITGDSINDRTQNKCKVGDQTGREERLGNINTGKTQTTPLQPLASYVETQTIATTHVQNVTQHLNPRRLLKDVGHQILHGQQFNVHNLLDVAGSLCAGPMGALCDMAAFSKMDCSPVGDLKDPQSNQDFPTKKYYHPLYAHGVCRWPGCELPLEDMATFVKSGTHDGCCCSHCKR